MQKLYHVNLRPWRKAVMLLLFCLGLLPALFLLPGCAWFRDDRPEPSGSPYAADIKTPKTFYAEAEAVNAAVSAISLRMAVSSEGPFRVVPTEKKTTSLGYKVIGSLSSMRLSRISAPCVLYLEDVRVGAGPWSLTLRHPDGRIFIVKTFQLDRLPEPGSAGESRMNR